VHKGTVVDQTRHNAPPGALFFAAGDDRTDEDLFAALPENAISVRVGSGATRADLRMESPFDLRRFLQELTDGGPNAA
jgi:trehalose 6-phosphate synthase/phosphatase